MGRLALLLCLCVCAACGPPQRDRDSGGADDRSDAGSLQADAGRAEADGGADAGSLPHPGRDAGPDAGVLDAGGPCSGWQQPGVARPNCGLAPLTVHFDGSGLTAGMNVTSIEWEFGDGDGSSNLDPVHVYRTVGDYEAVVHIVADYGGTLVTVNLDQLRVRVLPR